MGKRPSMFSRNYRRQVRKRRVRYIASISIIGLVILVSIFGNELKTVITNFSESIKFVKVDEEEKEELNQINDTTNTESVSDSTPKKTEVIEPISKEETFEVAINPNQNIKVTYINEENSKLFKDITGGETITYNISPSKDRAVILDSGTQDLYLVDLNKNVTNITKPQYVSTKNEVFKKDVILTQMKNYVWVEKPTFIDDTHIAYASSLPWINNSGIRYLWVVDTASGNHKSNTNVKGSNFQFGELTTKGLTLTIDNSTIYVDINGKVVK